MCEKAPIPWKKRGTDEMGYYFTEFTPGSADYNRVKTIFDTYLGGQGKPLPFILSLIHWC